MKWGSDRPLRLTPPRTHVTRIRPAPVVYDWTDDPELCGEADATPPHGIYRHFDSCWFDAELG